MSFLSKKRTKAWLITTAAVGAILIAGSVVATSVIPSLMDSMFGGNISVKSGETGSNIYFKADEDADTKEEVLSKANSLVKEICSEGTILLKNEHNVLPLTTSTSKKTKISVFGQNSVNLVYGSSGSVGGSTDTAPTIYDSLTSAGFEINDTLKNAYLNSGAKRPDSPSMGFSGSIPTGFATGEADKSIYTDDVISSFKSSDAAVVVISRTSGESYDLPMSMQNTEGAYAETDHYLELDKNEQEMLKIACDNFSKVVLVVNAATPMELGFLDAADDNDATVLDYDFASHIDGALQIGLPGENGIMALGEILDGTVVPSGKTVDTYARDFTTIPATQNFACNGTAGVDKYLLNGEQQSQYFMDYEEGIYIGYRYFETRGAKDGQDWYSKNVVYPFGYGLSYTSFSQEIVSQTVSPSNWKDNGEISFKVKVKNEGDYDGKDVVQIYATAPYTSKLQKAYKVLVGYGKTPLIPHGESKEVTVTFNAYDFASYDDSDANQNSFSGYELEKGEYTFSLGKNAHDVYDSYSVTLDSDVKFENDPVTGVKVENQFADADDQLKTIMSRDDFDGTFPKIRTDEEKTVDADFINITLKSTESGNPLTEDSQIVKDYVAKFPISKTKKSDGSQLYDMVYVDADGKLHTKDANDEAWDELTSRLTANTMFDYISSCAFKTPGIDYITKPATIDVDGPAGFTNSTVRKTNDIYDTCFYCSEAVLAATWNHDLATAMGRSIGNEGLVGDEKDTKVTYNGLYAPGMNLHRTPFGGRNPEYYSEDPLLSGDMAADVIAGAKEKGVYMFMKHFALNDQETHRNGVCTWANEQSIRELYLKPFEIAIKKGGATALMSSFNRIGTRWAGGSYALMTQVLRNEWGFNGAAITDFASGQSQMDLQQMIYAGGDMWLDTVKPGKWYSTASDLDVYLMQQCMKHSFYCVANSNIMNGYGDGVVYTEEMANWRKVLLAVDIAVPVLLFGWGVLEVVLYFVDKKKSK